MVRASRSIFLSFLKSKTECLSWARLSDGRRGCRAPGELSRGTPLPLCASPAPRPRSAADPPRFSAHCGTLPARSRPPTAGERSRQGAGPEVSAAGRGGPRRPRDAAAGSPSWGTRPPRLRAPARLLFTTAPFIPSPGAGRRNAIKRLSLEEMRGGGSIQRRAHCAGAEQRFSGPRPLSPQPVKRWVAGRSSAWNKIPTDLATIWGRTPGCPDGGQAPASLPSRDLTSIHF